ncbi:TIGR03086 family metal-binding protein [Kutzneria chonburiensis]|uniref:TIGR03086 family metal-binding protein n=1 Tax=Kutzneria chonburiensis TaxID=1483604 RepID=A0ABV6MYR2_9PSEU|nr:TIGR03086 family metal-binding protein [Kutzneria chonburiensis]
MAVLDDFDVAADEARRVARALTADQLGAPSKCAGWAVRDVLNHMVTGGLMAVSAIRGGPPPDRQADHLGPRPVATFEAALDDLRAALSEPGVLEQVYPTPLGPQPGSFLVTMRINELIVHSWDIAAATGQETDIAPTLAANALAAWRARLGDGPRPPAMPFDDPQPVPDGATAADALAAFLGRRQ